MLLFDPALEKGRRYCSEDQVSHGIGGVEFSETDEHLKAIPRYAKALPRDQKNGSWTPRCLADEISYFLHIPN